MLSTGLIKPDTSTYHGLLEVGEAEAPPARGPSFAERGFQFIPVRQSHLDFWAYVYGGEPFPLEEVEGSCMVDERYLPQGFAIIHLMPNEDGEGVVPTMYAHFGPWFRVYPKEMLRHIKLCGDSLRKRGLKWMYAESSPEVEGSDKLLEWAKAEPTGVVIDGRPQYLIDLSKSPI